MVQKGEFKLRGKIFILTILIIFLLLLVSFLTNYQIAESRHEKFETSEPDNILEDVDTDGDLLTDYDETHITHTDSNNPDSDGDGIPDGQEYEFWNDYYSNVKDQDSPQWLKDLYPLYDREKRQGQYTPTGDLDDDNVPNIMDKDSDGDGLTDGFELANGLDPADPESNLEDLPKNWKHLRFRQDPNRNAIDFPDYIYNIGSPDKLTTVPYDSILFTVEPAGYPRYWRTAVFDEYYNSAWRSDYTFEEYDNHEIEYEVEGYSDFEKLSYTVSFKTKWHGNIPTALHTTKVYDFDPTVDIVDYNNSGVFKVNDYIESYSFNSSIYHFDYKALSEAQLPDIIDNDNLISKKWMSDDIIDLGKSITSEVESPFDKAYEIAEYLVDNYVYDLNSYQYNYEIYLATLNGYSTGTDIYQKVLETMLFKTGTGTCIDFATAFVFLCRANDIPSRFVVGFTPGEIIDGERVVKAGHLHAWGEILLDDVEWLAFEVTPSITIPENTTGVGNSGADLNVVIVNSSTGDYFGGTGGGTSANNYLGYKKITQNKYIDSDFDDIINYYDTDDDNDEIPDIDELNNGTNPIDPDTDNDGFSDYDEINIYNTSPVNSDTDNDGLSDYFELEILKTDPLEPDTDGGGANDGLEYIYNGDPLDSTDDIYFLDSDYDGLSDGKELEIGTDPNKFDTDGGGANDLLEYANGFDPLDPSDDLKIIDSDFDGLMDQKEIDIGTDRFNADTDEGGVGDGFEYYYSNNPLNASDDYFLLDNDNDYLINKLERIYGTNENISDTDYGGVPDGVEVHEGYDPLNRSDDQLIDSDGDGLSDYYEYLYGTNPYDTDSDNDELSDYYEMNYYYDKDSYSHLDPNNIDTDGDSLPDDFEIAMGTDPTSKDTDGDGLDDDLELEWGSNPSLGDTDYDGINDYYEVEQYKTDPTLKDTDGDGIDDNLEDRYHTDPNMPDTDGDGISDYLEQSEYRTSPTDPNDGPDDHNERVTPDPYNNPNAHENNDPSTSQPSPNEWSDNNGDPPGKGGGDGGFSWILLIIGLILVIIIAFYYVSWRKRHIDEIKEVVEAAEKELTEIKDDFDDDEVRQAIFRAYKSMLRVMEKYEFTRKKWMTPREFEAIIKSALPIDKKHITNLTNIFEEARYSNHLMSDDFKAQALKSFRAIKVQLQTYNKGD